MHCFTGSAAELRDYAQRGWSGLGLGLGVRVRGEVLTLTLTLLEAEPGYYVGLTDFVAMRERGAALRAALREGALPLAQLMLETDSPFMRPDREHLPEVRRQPAWD